MANSYLEHHLALLQHLRNILGALGEAEQVPEATGCSSSVSTN